ncbi:nuclear transport factor 2 family protein [Granulicella cerasi]|uniref:Nuclear transport factor 2 family protein n=1 Tax=Granulicella cerasi TaxID=741063 RepID=A0ABW1ZDD1_9BACT|nr:nuclear transport factor 2 family protein [Granulicella cerasi]
MSNSRIRSFVLIAMLVSLCLPASAWWQHGKKTGKRDLRAEVSAADTQWRNAMLNSDAVALEKMLSEDYIGITSNGQVMTKIQWMDRMRSHAMQVKSLTVDDMKVKLVGQRVAIVTSSLDLEGDFDDHKVHGRFQSTRVFQRIDGTWKITNFESTRQRPYSHNQQTD